MHERYQMVVIVFVLLAYVTTRNIHFGIQFALLSALTLINQAVILFDVNEFLHFENLDRIMQIYSYINVLVFIYSAYICITYFLKEEKHDLLETETI